MSSPSDVRAPGSTVWVFGPYRLDADERRLTVEGEAVALTPKAFDLLLFLAERSDRLVRREELIAALWPDTFVGDGTLARQISALRKAIERKPEERFIETVSKSGYRFLGATPAAAPRVVPAARRLAWPARFFVVFAVATIALVAGALAGHLARKSQRPVTLVASRVTEPGAEEAYSRARLFLGRRTAVDLRAAADLFEQALAGGAQDQAAAEAGWATALALLAGSEDPIRNADSARVHALRALAFDPRCAEAHAALGLLAASRDGDWRAAEASFRRALEIEPDDVPANHWLGEMLSLLGRPVEGLALLERAHRSDPASLIVTTDIVKALFVAGRYDEAIARSEEVVEVDPGFAAVHLWRGFAHLGRDRPGDAAAGLSSVRLHARLDDSPLSRGYLAWALGRAGQVAESRRLLEDLERERRSTFIRPVVLALAHLGLGEYEDSIAELERELDSGGSLLGLGVVQPWQVLRPLPGFATVLRRANLDSESLLPSAV